jgi:hypothetical protein
MKAEFEFDLIKIFSSLIVNAKRIFTKTVVKKSRDKVQLKSDACLIKILSSLVVNAKRILFNSKWKLDQIVSFRRSIEDKKKEFFSKEKFFLCLNQQRSKLSESKNKIWLRTNCECFNRRWDLCKRTSSNFLERMI